MMKQSAAVGQSSLGGLLKGLSENLTPKRVRRLNLKHIYQSQTATSLCTVARP